MDFGGATMQAHLHLKYDCDPFVKTIADNQGRIPVQEHWPESLIEGEDAYLIDWSQLGAEQRLLLMTRIAVKEDISVEAARMHCRFGVPIGASQGHLIEVCGELHPLDGRPIYAPDSVCPWEEVDYEDCHNVCF
jgi:hypothetical protein